MKTKYYFINSTGEKTIARTSKHEYKYALIYKEKTAKKCSYSREAIEKEFAYLTKGYGHSFNEKVNGRYLWSEQFYNPSDLRIVELIKGEE